MCHTETGAKKAIGRKTLLFCLRNIEVLDRFAPSAFPGAESLAAFRGHDPRWTK